MPVPRLTVLLSALLAFSIALAAENPAAAQRRVKAEAPRVSDTAAKPARKWNKPGTWFRRSNRVESGPRRSLRQRIFGEAKRTTRVELDSLPARQRGLVRALSTRLSAEHGRRLYEYHSIDTLDSPDSNPLTGRDNFMVVTMENPRSKGVLSGAVKAFDGRARRRVLVEVHDAEALKKIGDMRPGKDGAPSKAQLAAVDKAFEEGVLKIHDDAPDSVVNRTARKLGGRGVLRRVARDALNSRGVRGGASENVGTGVALSALVLSPEPFSKPITGSFLAIRGYRAVRGIVRAVERRRVAYDAFIKDMTSFYAADFSNSSRPVLRRRVEDKGLPETIQSVETMHGLYKDYIKAIDAKADEIAGKKPETAPYEFVDFVDRFSRVRFSRGS